jgi:ferredoxin--NADP+ reductase
MADQASLAPVLPAHVQSARVVAVRHYTENLFSFACERPSAFRFRSGEFVMIGLMAGAKPLLRAYSIASPAWSDTLEFYSIKAPDGPLTSRLQHLKAGDEVLIGRKPTGTLVHDALAPGRRLVLLSSGTGIAPFASLIRDPETYERYRDVLLTQTCRTAPELAYGAAIVAETRHDPLVGEEATAKLRFVTSLTRAAHALEGRVTDLIRNGGLFSHVNAPALDPETDRVMICGSAPMLHELKAVLSERGFVEGSNHEAGSFVIERAFAG